VSAKAGFRLGKGVEWRSPGESGLGLRLIDWGVVDCELAVGFRTGDKAFSQPVPEPQ